jgi:thermitase
MRHTNLIRAGVAVAAVILFAAFTGGAFASGSPDHVEGQLIVKMASGVTEDEAVGVFDSQGCRMLAHSQLSGYYLVELAEPGGSVGDAVDLMRLDAKVAVAEPNYVYHPVEVPNDPLYSDQWGMEQLHMPDAWDVEQGDPDVVIAIADTGAKTDHEDLVNKLLQGRNTTYGADDPNDVTDYEGHGTHCAGIAAAETNNSLGVAGVAWDCRILPVKIGEPFTAYSASEGINWAADRADVISMSWGGSGDSTAIHEAIQAAYAKGVVLLGASGNKPLDVEVIYPARYTEVIAVGASGPAGEVASYSVGGPELDFLAPGGDSEVNHLETDMILSCGIASTDEYVYHEGTSMACPHAAGCAALLLSFGVDSADVRGFLQDTAEQPGGGTGRNDDYGYGIINMENALGAFGLRAQITTPPAGAILEYLRPTITVEFSNVDPATIVLSLDNYEVVSQTLGNVSDYFDPVTQILSYAPSPLSGGSHQVSIYAKNLQGTKEKTSELAFLVSPHRQAGGLTFWGLPYDISEESGGPQVVFGGNEWSLARYDPVSERYYVYNPFAQPQDPGASLDPPDPGVRPAGSPSGTQTPPRGLGYWLRLSPGQKVEMAVAATGPPTENYELDLVTGWNMIGNPFPYYVDWGILKVRYRGKEVTLQQAVDEDWINPAIYRYVRPTGEQTDGYYTWASGPEGKLRPWEAHWVKVLENTSNQQTWDPDLYGTSFDPRAHPVTLIVPAAESGSRGLGSGDEGDVDQNPNAGCPSERDDFRLLLSAKCGDAADPYNFAGVGSGAADGLDKWDVLEPPALPSPFVRLAFEGSGKRSIPPLAQDVRSDIGAGKKWEFSVETDVADTPVEITWPLMRKMPNSYDYILRDVASHKAVSLRSATRYRFVSGDGLTKRAFELEIKPASAATLMVTGVSVAPGRGGSAYGVSFNLSEDADVVVRVLSLTGKSLRTIQGGHRAAGISTLMWDRRDNTGRRAPKGAYICEVRAIDSESGCSRGIAPFFVR